VPGNAAVLAVVAVLVAGAAGPARAEPSLAARETERRARLAEEAEVLLQAGDKAYRESRYEEAVQAYTEARAGLSAGFRTAELRDAATERLAKAAVERARQLARIGEVEKAGQLLDTVLEVAPHHDAARQMRGQILDPLRYNPAVTPEHVRDVDEVRRLLYEAEGFEDLGEHDRARAVYEEVLRIDPANTAARRGMERLSKRRQEYFESARDETRAAMLTEVGAAWEAAVPRPVFVPGEAGLPGEGERLGPSIREKLQTLIVPVVDFERVGLEDAVDFLRQQSIQLDTLEPDDERRGISFVIELGTADPERTREILDRRFTLKLQNVPLRTVLDYVNQNTRTQSRIDDFAVVIRPAGAVGDDILTRTWVVPPDFLSREALPSGGGTTDPFSEPEEEGRLLTERLTAGQFLKDSGVSFPPGASAVFSPSTSTLTARNTSANLDLIDQIVEAMTEEQPLAVVIEVRLVNTSQNTLEELGFDWTTGNHNLATSNLFLGGGTVGNGTPLGDVPRGEGGNPVTSGLRSGNAAFSPNTIDAAINRQDLQPPSVSSSGTSLGGGAVVNFFPGTGSLSPEDNRAPGIISLLGVINDKAVTIMMRGVDQHKGIDLLTKKSVVTRPGQTANIESVREFIYPTEYEPPEIPNQVGFGGAIDPATGERLGGGGTVPITPAHPTAFETTKVGCMLEVLPQVGEDRNIVEVALKPVVRRFDGFINYGSPITGGSGGFGVDFGNVGNGGLPSFTGGGAFGQIAANEILMPVFSTIRAESNLTIADGETVLMGALHTGALTRIEDKVPILGDLPWVGRLFKSEAATYRKEALIILVTVRLQDPSGRAIRNR